MRDEHFRSNPTINDSRPVADAPADSVDDRDSFNPTAEFIDKQAALGGEAPRSARPKANREK